MRKGTGYSHTPLFKKSASMKGRCYVKSSTNYARYGARGVTVCDEWRYDFQAFKEWSEKNGYTDGLTIDRINSAKGYEPSNCRWITRSENSRHRAGVHRFSDGRTTADVARELGIGRTSVLDRIKSGMPLDLVESLPPRPGVRRFDAVEGRAGK